MKVMKAVLAAAKDDLNGRTISDLVVGISLIGVQLSDGHVGVSYVVREHLPAGCSVFPYVCESLGRPAEEVANWTISGSDDLQRGVGLAVLSAASQGQPLEDDKRTEVPFGLSITKDDTVGMVGYIPPVADPIIERCGKMVIFDEGLSRMGGNVLLSSMEEQPELLPDCSVVLLSGSSAANGTLDGLLSLCKNAREVVLLGSSTPMFPHGFTGTPVTRLAGSVWRNDGKEELFRSISLAGGIMQTRRFMEKKLALVK
jgi:uncharacterized protein (DUF4213/DUF364 family)